MDPTPSAAGQAPGAMRKPDEAVLLASRYRLHDRVGRGGMADVFAATDEVLERAVAVKLFRFDGDNAADRDRMRTEVRVLASLSHPNLVTVFDASIDGILHGGQPFLVMELVDGPSLREHLVAGTLDSRAAAALGAGVAAGLDHAHARAVVHRDVKPANVLLARADATGEHPGAFTAKLADFGIARLLDSTRVTMVGTTIGTANYLSPEQVAGGDVGPASDVYSLGLVLIECLTGEVAYPGTGIEAALPRLHRPPAIPTEHGAAWAELLAAMTADPPEARPTAAQVQAALQALTADRTGTAPLAPTRPLPVDHRTSAGTARAGSAASTEPGTEPGTEPQDTSEVVDTTRLRPLARLVRTRPWWVAFAGVVVVGLAVLVLSLTTTGNGTATPTPPAYPVVPGQLGRDLHELQQAVG